MNPRPPAPRPQRPTEMWRAVARELASGWTLVFPALRAGDPGLALCTSTVPSTGDPPLGIVNRILAVREGAAAARGAARDTWRHFAQCAVRNGAALLRADLAPRHRPDAVVDDFLEVLAAWTTFDRPEEYAEARRTLDRAVASRKRARDFRAWPGRAGLPKSSLDGVGFVKRTAGHPPGSSCPSPASHWTRG